MISRAKEEHFGQVLPIQEISGLVRQAKSVVRMPCACRWNIDKKEARCCYAISYGPEAWFRDIDMGYFGKTSDEGLESLSPDTAIQQMEKMEEDGAVHTIWTMMTPFIGAICNCSPEECIAMRTLPLKEGGRGVVNTSQPSSDLQQSHMCQRNPEWFRGLI
jgi:hypothetical protein